MKYNRIVILAIVFVLFFSTVQANKRNFTTSSQDTLKQVSWVDSIMQQLTLRDKIGQLFMVAAYSNRDNTHIQEIADLVKNQHIGGLIFFQGGPVRQALQTNYYQSLAKIPMLISMDAEWGPGMRLDSTFSYPRQMMLGASADSLLVYQMGCDIARQLKRLGVHINFAPVVDINSNPQNPVINTRSFGENRDRVVKFGLAYMAGLQDNGLIACAKHFPGHGDTYEDSHVALPTVSHTLERLDSIETYPFKQLVKGGLNSIMVAHLRVPALESDSLKPSSISSHIINNILINEIGFKGLIFTDALNMKGIANYYDAVEINVLALKAGNDILLFPSKVKESIDKIESLIKSGDISENDINQKCRKVLMAKYYVGLNSYSPIDTANLYKDLNTISSQVLRRKIIANSLTVVSNNNILPLKGLDTLKIAYLEIGTNKGDAFREQLELYSPISTFTINPESSVAEYDSLLFALEPYNLIIVGYHAADIRFSKSYGITYQAANLLFDLAFRKKVILDYFGTPYSIGKFFNPQSFSSIIISYDNSYDAQNLSAQLIFGGISAKGQLPVSVVNSYTLGTGNQISGGKRLSYMLPEEIGIDSKFLQKVDSIAYDAIQKGVTPGMQILAAKDGVVFFNKSFGKPTYSSQENVDIRMLYDIASVTKVTATLPVLMKLYDDSKITLSSTLGMFTKLDSYTDKSAITIKDLLLHQSGLQPWIPFYLKTLSTLVPNTQVAQETLSGDYPFKVSEKAYLHKYVAPSTRYYSSKWSFNFPLKCAENIYSCEGIKDTLFNIINSSKLQDAGKYRYSDLGFLYLQRVVENISNKGLDELADSIFYKKLGMNYTLFQPTNRFDKERIVPTEYDLTFRKQLVWGNVHDPAAAMIGGVAGHAGVFSNANDLAKLMQMYLRGGLYGDERYLKTETISNFTNTPNGNNGNRRALGFDKPSPKGEPSPAGDLASPKSFGHTGFTGTVVWADPETGLIYIFLSNRVYPDANNTKLAGMNIRTKIHDIFYKAIGQ
ncbi:beta-N-acetylglucosaminidase [Tenuifilaceae bacterium CYCD]|nr:beta-N-acetylglucosaminidase [Tenuifilaceae bacterium CYCD]